MEDWQPLGKHLVRIEGEIVHARWQGEVTLAETQELFGLYAKVQAEKGRVFSLSDMRHSGVPPAEVRRWIANWMAERPRLDGVAAYGANFMVRAAFVMLLRGIMLLSKMPYRFDVCATEAEGREWLDRLRAELPCP